MQGLFLKQGSTIDATLIPAPVSTKNKDKARDPEMHSSKKGNQWHFGMKAHIGSDTKSRTVHSLATTAANEADIQSAIWVNPQLPANTAKAASAETRPIALRTVTGSRRMKIPSSAATMNPISPKIATISTIFNI